MTHSHISAATFPMASLVRACVRCRKLKAKCVYENGRAPCKHCAKGMHECCLPSKSMSDIYGDELYNPNFAINASPTQHFPATGNDLFAQRLIAADANGSTDSTYASQVAGPVSQDLPPNSALPYSGMTPNYSRSCSASSVGSAYSQCREAVVSGPPKKGRRRPHGRSTAKFEPSGAPWIAPKSPPSSRRGSIQGWLRRETDNTLEEKVTFLEDQVRPRNRLASLQSRENHLLRGALAAKGYPVEEIAVMNASSAADELLGTIHDQSLIYPAGLFHELETRMSKLESAAFWLGLDESRINEDDFLGYPLWEKALRPPSSENRPASPGKQGSPNSIPEESVSRTLPEAITKGDGEVLDEQVKPFTKELEVLARAAKRRIPQQSPQSSRASSSRRHKVRRKRRRVNIDVSKRKKSCLCPETAGILSKWLAQHEPHEEPSESAIEALSVQTGLSKRRVALWLWLHGSQPSQPPIQTWLMSSSDEESGAEPDIRDTLQAMQATGGEYHGQGRAGLIDQDLADIEGPGYASAAVKVAEQTQCVSPDRVGVTVETVVEETLNLDEPWARNELWAGAWPNESANHSFENALSPTLLALLETEIAHEPTNTIPEAPQQLNAADALARSREVGRPRRQRFNGNRPPEPQLQDVALEPDSNPAPRQSEKDMDKAKANFQCTFCHVSLTEGAWKRHEESQHLPRTRWTCMGAEGATCVPFNPSRAGATKSFRCAFCPTIFSTTASAYRHAYREHAKINDCVERSVDERTFLRRDNLQQHASQYHGCKEALSPEVVAAWETKGSEEQDWTCGFCGELLPSWTKRAVHLRKHFRQGATMQERRDGWGAPVDNTGD